jgi:kynurenine 3-monooxygenase
MNNDIARQDVVVVGAGLVGALLARVLVRRGHRVQVFEGRDDLRRAGADGGRSINLVLTRRGIRALDRVGLSEGALRLTVPVTGRRMHDLDGSTTYQPYGRDASECNHSISRGDLNRFLIEEAERAGARFRFRTRLLDADPDTARLTFEDDASGERFSVQAGVAFGADGAGSAMREAFGRLDGFDESTEMLSHGYKELFLPADEDGSYRIEKHALHIWPRGASMFMALANLAGSFPGTLYLPLEGRDGFDAIGDGDGEAVMRLFGERFPDAIPLIPDLPRSYFDNPTGKLGTVRCGPWHRGGRTLLLGDAAHAIVPFFGQGMNTGFEDCRVLDDLLDRFGDDAWDQVFPEFDRLRKPDADAIAAMALENFVEMSAHVGDAAFLLRKAVEHRLEQEEPTRYRSRYSMVMYSHIRFHLCREAGRVQRALLDELCDGLDSAEALDMDRARDRIDARFAPFLREHGITLDY